MNAVGTVLIIADLLEQYAAPAWFNWLEQQWKPPGHEATDVGRPLPGTGTDGRIYSIQLRWRVTNYGWPGQSGEFHRTLSVPGPIHKIVTSRVFAGWINSNPAELVRNPAWSVGQQIIETFGTNTERVYRLIVIHGNPPRVSAHTLWGANVRNFNLVFDWITATVLNPDPQGFVPNPAVVPFRRPKSPQTSPKLPPISPAQPTLPTVPRPSPEPKRPRRPSTQPVPVPLLPYNPVPRTPVFPYQPGGGDGGRETEEERDRTRQPFAPPLAPPIAPPQRLPRVAPPLTAPVNPPYRVPYHPPVIPPSADPDRSPLVVPTPVVPVPLIPPYEINTPVADPDLERLRQMLVRIITRECPDPCPPCPHERESNTNPRDSHPVTLLYLNSTEEGCQLQSVALPSGTLPDSVIEQINDTARFAQQFCGTEPVLAPPCDYPVARHRPPQLVAIFATVDPQSGTRGHYTLSVPHWVSSYEDTIRLQWPLIQKGGPHLTRIRFPDNTQIVIQCVSETHALAVWQFLQPHIDPAIAQSAEIISSTSSVQRRAHVVRLRQLRYYDGSTRSHPLWKYYVPVQFSSPML